MPALRDEETRRAADAERERKKEWCGGRVGFYRLSAGVGKRAGFDGFKHGLPLLPCPNHTPSRAIQREGERVVKTTRMLAFHAGAKMLVIDRRNRDTRSYSAPPNDGSHLHFAPTMDRLSEMRRNLDLHR